MQEDITPIRVNSYPFILVLVTTSLFYKYIFYGPKLNDYFKYAEIKSGFQMHTKKDIFDLFVFPFACLIYSTLI